MELLAAGPAQRLTTAYTTMGTTCRVTSLIRNIPPVGTYSSFKPRDLWWSWGGGASYSRGAPVFALSNLVRLGSFPLQS